LLCLLLLCALGLVATVRGGALGLDRALTSMRAGVETRTLIALAPIYAIAKALPFVPGMELGWLLMLALGARGVLLVYGARLLGLSASYAVGRCLPMRLTPPTSQSTGVALAPPKPDATGTLQTPVSGLRIGRWVPVRLVAWLAAHRYLALVIGLNLPGNVVGGGGGGLALLCGLSGQYSYRRYLPTVAVAISPLPMLLLVCRLEPEFVKLTPHFFRPCGWVDRLALLASDAVVAVCAVQPSNTGLLRTGIAPNRLLGGRWLHRDRKHALES
jgi:hypothetical protein